MFFKKRSGMNKIHRKIEQALYNYLKNGKFSYDKNMYMIYLYYTYI